MNTTENSPYVVGVDGSVGARHAIRWASRAAVMHKAPVLLLHAIGVPEHYAGVLPPSPTVFEALWGHGNALLDEAAELAESFGVVDVRTESGSTVRTRSCVTPHGTLACLFSVLRGTGDSPMWLR